jgi:hypothetical protein
MPILTGTGSDKKDVMAITAKIMNQVNGRSNWNRKILVIGIEPTVIKRTSIFCDIVDEHGFAE